MGLRIVDRTPGALVVVKPAGLASELPRDEHADSLVRRLETEGHTGLRLVHRLDTPACGLMLVAQSRAAAAHYTRQIEARQWLKWYVARVSVASGWAQRLVGPHKAFLKSAEGVATVVRAGGRPSFLDVAAAAAVPDDSGDTHLLIRLHTGRYHQIRVMLAHAGAPLTGDQTYGGRPGAPMYLEHVVLGTHADTSGAWTVWQAPAHGDRDPWAPALTTAIEARAATARTAPPPPVPVP